jgi:Outer membrane protein beta-barrel domain
VAGRSRLARHVGSFPGWLWALLLGVAAVAAPARAAEDGHPFYLTVYLQDAWPKQSVTNAQIQQINGMFGTNFDDWSDVANLSVGAQLFKRVSPRWKLGVQVDYSQGAIKGHATVPTEAGPARLAFEQRYSAYADLYLVAHYLPCPSCTRVVPFLYGGGGFGYEKDRTTLALTNEYLDQHLLVDNDGWFPTFSAGVGADVPLSRAGDWYVEFGAAYVWARMTHTVPASGALAPAPRVTADTDFTGPNVWIGLGTRF